MRRGLNCDTPPVGVYYLSLSRRPLWRAKRPRWQGPLARLLQNLGSTVSESWEAAALNGESLNGYTRAQQLSVGTADEIEQNLRLQGQYLDRDTGLHYNTFRFYDPDIGRFISPDPIGLWGGLNIQLFAPNPTGWVDPTGLYNGEGTRELGEYHTSHEHTLKPGEYTLKDSEHIRRGNESVYRRAQTDPQFRRMLQSKYPGALDHVSPTKTGRFRGSSPPGMTWHHGDSPGSLKLVNARDHRDFHKIYHPDGKGGRNKWGGGTGCR
jgi:RHS repeat-associated protein